MRPLTRLIFAALGLAATSSAQAINFNFITNGFDSEATAALNRAGSRWSSQLLDPVTINISVNLQNLNDPQVIGNAQAVSLYSDYSVYRDAMITDASNEADDGVVSYLPAVNQASAFVPADFSLINLAATKANLKALGDSSVFASMLDQQFGIDDGIINFNNGFAFDYDASNGISAGTMDFETVAAHEIGHILGFVSAVDDIDYMLENNFSGEVTPYLLDMFRFGFSENPSTPSEFTNMPRELRPGVASFFDDLSTEVAFSTGAFNGDGNQASHWKADELAGVFLGIMDPTLAYTQSSDITRFDLRALDVIGYEVAAVPLPSSIWLFTGSLLAMAALVGQQARRE